MKVWLSNGNIASQVNDFEQVMSQEDFRGLTDILKAEQEDREYNLEDYRDRYEREELHSDALYQQNISAWNMLSDMITYLEDSSRINRKTLIQMVKEVQNQLEDY